MSTRVLASRLCLLLLGVWVSCSGPRPAQDQSEEHGERDLDANDESDDGGPEPGAADDASEREVSDAESGRGSHRTRSDDARLDAMTRASDVGLDAGKPTLDASEGGPNHSALDGGSADAALYDAAPSAPEAGACVKTVRAAGKTTPDIMIVLDRSGSMRTTLDPKINCSGVDPVTAALLGPVECATVNCMDPLWMVSTACGGTALTPGIDRWTPALSAIKSLTSMFETRVNFGLVTFPAGTGSVTMTGSTSNESCSPGTVRVPLATNTATAIAQALDATQPAGYTPTSSTLQSVLESIRMRKAAANAMLPPQFLLLVTDGAPNCIGSSLDNDTQAHTATLQVLDALAQEGVKTFVIGYDATVDARLAMQLSEYAQHGGTDHFYPVQDASGLAGEIVEITDVVVDCTYTLDQAPPNAMRVHVELDQETLQADAEGFSLQGKTLTIRGAACAKLRDPNTHTLTVTFECATP